MKVSQMEVIPLCMPLENPFYQPWVMEKIYPVVVRLYTDDGADSYGICFTFSRPHSLAACIEDLKDLVVGTDVMRGAETWQKMFQATKPMGHQGYPIYALSAIDTAIWGLRATAAGIPLVQFLGGLRDRTPAYASYLLWRDRDVDQLQKEGASLVEQGFRMIKMKMGGRPFKEEKARLRALREAVGEDIDIMADANWSWSVVEALTAGRMLEDEGIYWLEDPLSNEDPLQLAQLATALDVPIAVGENFSTKYEFRNLILNKSSDFLIIDLQAVGGVTEWMNVAAMAQAWNIPVVSHVFSELSVHLTAATPNCPCLEYMPWLRRIFANPAELKDGYLYTPSGPGLGMELDIEILAKYRLT
jgi:L-alanine-DL-glutamate epimerase-like enolase superfamily enzyme